MSAALHNPALQNLARPAVAQTGGDADILWTAAMDRFQAARVNEVTYNQQRWMPAYSVSKNGGPPIPVDIDAEIERLTDLRFVAEDALVETPAPHLSGVIWKLEYARERWAEQEEWPDDWWTSIMADLRRLAVARGEFDPAHWLSDFETVGGGFVIAETGVQICVMLHGYPPSANREAKRLFDLINNDPVKQEAVIGLILARNRAALVEGEGA